MTPKEKAKELYFKMHSQEQIVSKEAKQCALIAVDEILNINPFSFYDKRFHLDRIKEYEKYWVEVKEEIEKL
jgi:hypothetical protein